jgi:Ca2+-binding EF-hand superfamily protein
MDYENDIKPLIDKILLDPKNIATPHELEQQAKACVAALIRADKDQNNIITFDEIGTLSEILGLPIQSEESFDQYDTNQTGTLENHEFLEWWLNRISKQPGNKKQQEILALNTFKTFDQDQSGAIDIQEFNALIQSLGVTFTDKELEEAIQELDADKSTKIDQEEFLSWWVNRTQNVRKGGGLIAYKLKKLINKAAQRYQTDLFTAIWKSQLSLVKLFLENEPLLINSLDTSEDGNEWSGLHYAAYRGDMIIMTFLLDCDHVNVNIRNRDGFTPLFYAAQQGHEEICELLLSHGADPSLAGYDSNLYHDTPPMCSVDLLVDTPSLTDLFLSHDKCIKPLSKPILRAAKLTSEGVLSLEMMNYGQISPLPLSQWNLSFYSGDRLLVQRVIKKFTLLDYNLLTQSGNSNTNGGAVTVMCQPPVEDLEVLIKSVATVPPNQRNQSLEVVVLAVNAIGEGNELSDRYFLDLRDILGN